MTGADGTSATTAAAGSAEAAPRVADGAPSLAAAASGDVTSDLRAVETADTAAASSTEWLPAETLELDRVTIPEAGAIIGGSGGVCVVDEDDVCVDRGGAAMRADRSLRFRMSASIAAIGLSSASAATPVAVSAPPADAPAVAVALANDGDAARAAVAELTFGLGNADDTADAARNMRRRASSARKSSVMPSNGRSRQYLSSPPAIDGEPQTTQPRRPCAMQCGALIPWW